MQKSEISSYDKTVKTADLISKEMSFLYANYQIFNIGREEVVVDNFLHTYSGHAWKIIQRGLINQIFLTVSKLVDEDSRTASLLTLKHGNPHF